MHFYGFGSNGSGQLGVGHEKDLNKPEACRFLSAENRSSTSSNFSGTPLRVAAGGNSTYILTDEHKIYQAGRKYLTANTSDEGETGNLHEFSQLDCLNDRKIKLCSSTWEAAYFVDIDNNILTQGTGPKGELGLGLKVTSSVSIQVISKFLPAGEEIIDIASSVSHTVVVSSNGEAYGWGNGRKGELGQPSELVWKPRKIMGADFKIVRAVCGKEFTCLLGPRQTSQYLIIGSDKWQIKSKLPESMPLWKEVGASWGSLFMLSCDGNITSWGRNDRGQLAPANLPSIESIAVGSEHVLALTTDGRVLCWGWGEHGNCGEKTNQDGNVDGLWNELEIEGPEQHKKVLGVAAGCATSFFWIIDTVGNI